jgi:hypothetical protein
MNQLARLLAGLLALSCLVLALSAEEVWHEDEGWGVNLPEGWVLMDSRSDVGNLNFSDPAGHAILQVFGVTAPAREFLAGLQATMKAKPVAGKLVGQGGGTVFRFNGAEARLVEASWDAGKLPVRGYILAAEAPAGAGQGAVVGQAAAPAATGWVLTAFALDKEWDAYRDQLLSVLDSFFVGEDAMYLPGPVSQAMAGDGWSGGPLIDAATAVRTAQAVADREAEILSSYQSAEPDVQEKAWRRFYQMLWKDNYARLDDVSDEVSRLFAKQRVARDRQPAELLAWVQSFAAETYGSLADLRVPVDAMAQKKGDCDGRSLVYMILLEHLGFSNVLMVSSVYRHAMVGIDAKQAGIKAAGATFRVDGRDWLVAETMAQVALGQIAQDKADQRNWMGFDLHFKP